MFRRPLPRWPPFGDLRLEAEREHVDDRKILTLRAGWNRRSEVELRLQLNHPRRRISPKAVSEKAGGRVFQERDFPKPLVRTEVIRSAKVRMVEEIKELETDSQNGILPTRDLGILHDAKIGIEIARIAEPIAPLCKRNHRPVAARARRAQSSGIETGFATLLHEKRSGIGIPIHYLRRQARVRRQRNGRTFSTRRAGRKRVDRHSIDRSEIVLLSKSTGLGEVKYGVRETGSGKDRSRHLPSLHQIIRAMPAESRLHWKIPHIVRIDGMTYIVLRRSVAATQIVRVLGIQRAAECEGKQATVRHFIEGVATSIVHLKQTVAPTGKALPE